jgi:thiamine pyrophosphokinase
LVGPASMKILTSGIISAIPLGACSDVTLSGVEWPVAGSAMAPLGFRSVSNVGTGEIEVSVGDGALMICWEYAGMPIWDPFLP